MVKVAKFDVRAAADKGADLILRHPTSNDILVGEDGKTRAIITVQGSDSKAYRDFIRAKTRDRLQKAEREGQMAQALNFDGAEQEDAELYAEITTGWSGIEGDAGELAFTKDNAIKLYLEQSWIREQISKFVNNRANFLRA